MEENDNLNPQVVHDAAAFLFWSHASKKGVSSTINDVIESFGQCLFDQPFTDSIFKAYGVDDLHHAQQLEFREAIASEATTYTREERNLEGIIYQEDGIKGRSPSAQDVDTLILKPPPKKIKSNCKIETHGDLCLRYPLPAVLFVSAKPTTLFRLHKI